MQRKKAYEYERLKGEQAIRAEVCESQEEWRTEIEIYIYKWVVIFY